MNRFIHKFEVLLPYATRCRLKFNHDLKTTTDWSLVTCPDCLKFKRLR